MGVRRSIGFPLVLASLLTVLLLALAVGWQILVVGDPRPVAAGLSTMDWVFLILGTLFFVLVLAGIVWISAWLVREMRLNQRQRAFLDAVTHEMKTPLAALRLYVETLAKHDPDLEKRRHFLARMGEDLDRLDRTVDQVLAAARAEEPGVRPVRDPVALRELLEGCVTELRERYALTDGAVRLVCAESIGRVQGNASELVVVFRNLLENAVKYSEAPVDVSVRVAGRGESVEVAIVDRGIGIDQVELRKIFQRFYRAGRDVQRTAAGLGLGLFIVRNLVRRQGGRVVARSDGSGKGSRFVVTLRAAA